MNDYDYARFTESLFDEDYQNETMDFQSEIDALFNEVESYRKSGKFLEIVDFCAKFNHIAPFNAMLIEMQRPGSRLALTAREWARRFKRGLIPNAQPLIYLNMTPVGAMYDISDTIPLGENGRTDQEIIEEVAHPFKGKGAFDLQLLQNLKDNLQYYGIALDDRFNASDTFGAKIQRLAVKKTVYVKTRHGLVCFEWPMPYLISINKNADDLQTIQALCHELAHFFCHHLIPETPEWWKLRKHDTTIREFEAETTAYLVCKRNHIPCPNSKDYLAHYVGHNDEIPRNISVEIIMKAVTEIEKMMRPMSWSDGYLYKKDPRFKEKLDEVRGAKKKRNRQG